MQAAERLSRRRYTLTPRVDLAVLYAADAARFKGGAGQATLEAVTLDVFTAFYANCPSRGFACDEKPIGGVIFDGTAGHIAVQAEHHGHWGFLLAPVLDWLFALKPEIQVDLEADNTTAVAFMARNGWQRLERADGNPERITFLMTPRHTRRRVRR